MDTISQRTKQILEDQNITPTTPGKIYVVNQQPTLYLPPFQIHLSYL